MITLFSLAWLGASVASAEDVPPTEQVTEARALYEQGVRYYERQEYDTAIRLWRKSYELTPHSEILHNIAKAHEEASQPREALAAWKEYAAVAPADQQEVARVKIYELELVLAALAEEPEPVVTAPVPAPAPVPEPAPPPVVDEREPRSYRGLAVVGLAVGAAGSAGVGGWLAADARSDATQAATAGCVSASGAVLCDGDAQAALSSDRLRFGIGLGMVGGGAALGAGAVLVALAPRRDAEGVSVFAKPDGFLVVGRF